MITITKDGNAIKFTFVNNGHYLTNGEIEVPLNSLSLVTDDSGMASFKRSATNDTFISATYEELGMSKADLESWYKENMVGETSGGGDITSGEVQTMIDESISGKADSSAVTEEISAAVSGKADISDIPDVSNYFDGAEYDSGTTRINFYHGNTVKAYIDASAFIVDGMIDDVRIETISGVTYLVIDFNTESGKEDIQIPITDIFDSSNYYNKSEIDSIVSGLNDSIDEKLDASAYTPTDLSEYWTSAQTETAISNATSGKADTSAVTESINAAVSGKQDILSAGTGIEIDSANTISVTGGGITSGEVQTMIDESISGKVDTSAITSSVTSASTDSEVPTAKAVHGVATTDEYPIEGVLSAKHFWDDENMGAYTEIGSLNNIKVPNSSLLSNPYISYVFAENEEFMGDTCALVATVTSGSIASVELLNGSSVSSVTATYDNDYMYFTTSASSFSADGLNIVAVMGNDFKPSNVMELRMQITESAVDCGVISVVGNIPSEPTKDSIKRIYDALSSFEDVNPIADTITLDNGNNNSGRDNTLIGYGVLNYNTYNPLTNTITSGNTADVFKYNVIDFKGDNNVLRFNKTIIDKSTYSSTTPQFAISSFTDSDTSTYNYQIFTLETCMIVETNPNASGGGGMGDEISISISGPNNIEGEISFQLQNSTLEVNVTYNNKTVNKVLYSFAYGESFLIDLREYWDDTYGTHTFTVGNWRGSDMLTSISFYNVVDRNQLHLEDAVEMLMDKETITLDELDDKLIDYASIESVNIYEYGNPSAVTVSTSSLNGTFYGFSVSGIPSGSSAEWYISDGQVSIPYGMKNGVIDNNNDSTFDHCISKELTNYENGVVNVFLNTSDAYISRIYMSSQSYQGTVYQSITVTPIKDALSGKVDTSAITSSVTSASTDSEVPTAKAVHDAISAGGGGGKAIEGGRGITVTTGATADTVSFNLPISASTTNNNLLIGDASNKIYNQDMPHTDNCIVFGRYNYVKSYDSLVGGYQCSNEKGQSQSFGNYTKTKNQYEFGCGKYNNSVSPSTTFGDSGNTLFSVGNGTADNARHNAFEIRQNGDIYITSGSTDIKLQDHLGGGGGGGLDDDTQLLLSTALTDLNDRKADKSLLSNYQRKGDYATKSELAAKANVSDVMTLEKAKENEQVTSYALNNLNNRVTDNTTALGGMKLVKITESEYAALTTKDENTLYVVVADPE